MRPSFSAWCVRLGGKVEKATYLVTGATGAIGPRLVHTLSEAGHRVRILSRGAPPAGLMPSDVEMYLGDIIDPLAVQSAMQGVDVVMHLAALLHIADPSPDLRERYQQVNGGGTDTVVHAAIQEGVRRLVLFSTISIYGCTNGQVVTEDTPPQPDTLYGQTKLAAEHIVLQARRSNGQSLGTVLRLGPVYGTRMKGNYRRLVHAVARGWFIPIGGGANRRPLIYDRDVAQAAMLAAQHPDAAGRVYNLCDGQFYMLNDIITTMCEALGRQPPRFVLPIRPVRWAVGLLEETGRLVGYQSPIGRATIEKYIEDLPVDSRRIQTELGFTPRFDLRTGWQETIEEMRRNGEL
jgi:nucleoside-diphosphate-sugar epimerase